MKLNRVLFFLAAVIVFTLTACGPKGTTSGTPEGTGATETEPIVLRIGWAGSPDTLNPAAAILSEAWSIYELTYSALYQLNLDGTFSLDLAKSVQRSDDGLTYTYELQPGVKFHDGTPLTAKDVVFSFNFYHDHEDFPYMNSYTTYFDKVEATSDTTVVLTLTEPISNIESQLNYLFILPEHIWKDHTEGAAATEFENAELIGSGPFKLVEFKQNELVHLAVNPDFYGTMPKVDEVVFQTFTNEDALVQSIKTGQVDMITEMPNTAVATLKNAENVEVVVGAPLAPELTDIIFNQVDPANCPEDGSCTGHPALRDKQVRLAIAYATNKQDLIDVILLGLGTPGLTLIPDSLGIWYNNTIEDYPFDIAKGNEILDAAGYKDLDGDGVREMPDGSQSLVFRLNWPNDSTVAPRLAEMVSKTWAQIGVKVELQALDPDALTSICCPTFDYDILIWGWGSDPDPSFLLSVMTSAEIPTGMSETGYANAEYDQMYKEQTSALDVESRKEIVWNMQKLVHDDVVYVIPFYAKAVQAYRTDRFTGWKTDQPKLAMEDPTSLLYVEPVK